MGGGEMGGQMGGQVAGQMGQMAANAWFGAGQQNAPGFNQQLAASIAQEGFTRVNDEFVARWFPGFYTSLQKYFNVGHLYVLRKLMLILCPFPVLFRRGQGAPQPWDSAQQEKHGAGGLKNNVEEPDLYIPLMSFVTYVLVYGMQRGILSDFHPEVLSSTASFASVLLILEVTCTKCAFYVAGSAIPVYDIIANAGYKYAPLVLIVLCRIILGGNFVYYGFFVYLSTAAAVAIRHFLMNTEPANPEMRQQYGLAKNPLHFYIVTALAALQLPLCWLLTPSTASA